MKKIVVFLGVVVVLSVAFGLFSSREAAAPVEEKVALTSACFTRDVVATTEAPYSVHETIEITIDGVMVSGTKSGTQAGPDMTNGYTGTLSGMLLGDRLSLHYDYTIEGSMQSEAEEYLLRGSSLFKQRYPLMEANGVLVPDTTKEVVEQEYKAVPCI